MDSKDRTVLPFEEAAARRARRREAMQLQRLEGNPLDDEDVALLDMFERKGWSYERRRAYIVARARGEAVPDAAE